MGTLLALTIFGFKLRCQEETGDVGEERRLLTEDFPSLQVPPDAYHETCLFAYCVRATAGSGPEGQAEALCATFANYAQACARQHIYVRWRKPGFCGMLGLPPITN